MMNSPVFSGSLAIIPARGGSKGLPRKNVRLLGDKPLIAYTIHAAINSGIDRVIVSTDDQEIADIAKQYGAEVPFLRPPEYSGDQATSLSVLQHAVQYMENQQAMQVQHVVFLQPTSPFRSEFHLQEAILQYQNSQKISLISITDVQEFHPYFMFKIAEQNTLKPLHEMENRPLRRQDLPLFYRINGAIYITHRDYYLNLPETAAIFDWNSLSGYIMDAPSSVDINDYVDFQRAELMLQKTSEDFA